MDEVIKSEIDRIHDEDNRQNERLKNLEANQEELHKLAMTVQELATNITHLVEAQNEFSIRLKAIENVPIDNMKFLKRELLSVIISIIFGGILGFLMKGVF